MDSEASKPSPSPSAEREQNNHLDRKIKEMISAINQCTFDVRKPGSQEVDQDDHGVSIITLAGQNSGATLRGELGEKTSPDVGFSLGEPEALSTYVNSNFQAINNSIMMSGSYSSNDPGVHLDISDFFPDKGHKPGKHAKKEKKKEKEKEKSDHNSDHPVESS